MDADKARELMDMIGTTDASPFAKTVFRAVVDASALGVDQGEIAEEMVRLAAALCAGRVRGARQLTKVAAAYSWIGLFSARLLVSSGVTPEDLAAEVQGRELEG